MVFPRSSQRSPSAQPHPPVRIWDVQDRRSNPRFKRPWLVRWSVDGREFSRPHRTRTEADRFRMQLFAAQENGEGFDRTTGEPTSWAPNDQDLTVYEWARRYVAEHWDEWQPRTRRSNLEALGRFIPLVVHDEAARPPERIRVYLAATLVPAAQLDHEHPAEQWLTTSCLCLHELTRSMLSVVVRQLGVGDAGQALATTTATRYRTVARSCITRAVDLQVLAVDPWPPYSRGRSRRKAVRAKRGVNIKVLPDPITMAAAIDAIVTTKPGSRTYRVMTAVAYYAGLRPSEVAMLRPRALTLPDQGWGRIDVTEADIDYDQPGEPKTGERTVPIPPVLVDILRSWLDGHAFSDADLIFRTNNGTRPMAQNWGRAWKRALASIGHDPLRVYDCRHAAATTWLRAGVPLGEVARRLGHSVDTLVTTYVGALEGDEAPSNAQIEAALAPGGSTATPRAGAAPAPDSVN